jgi:NTE family protein
MATRPRIGLALGSGAGRGWAHIGVLRGLERAGVEIDLLCGTSMGALIGGLYLAGHLEAVEEWTRELSTLRILRYLDFRVAGGGLIGGGRLTSTLDQALGDTTIEELPKPFAAVATELPSGHEIWLTQGSLVEALRASFALPGLFTPVPYDGHWLVDGALVNPVPVSVCRAFRARLVIAVNLNADIIGKVPGVKGGGDGEAERPDQDRDGSPAGSGAGRGKSMNSLLRRVLRGGDEGPSLFNIMVSSLGVIQDRLTRSRLAGDPPDVTIAPRLGHIGLLDFDRAEETIAEGEAAVERALPFLHDALTVLG